MGKDILKGNAVVAQSGGPTAVINQSLVGVVEGLRGNASVSKVYGARHGVRGMVDALFVDLFAVEREQLELIAATPSAALGSSRDKPDAEYCGRILEKLRQRDIRYFFYIGGNDSSDTCRIVNQLAAESGYELRCFHVPKTVDNDLVMSDHTPGYPSAARFVAMAFMGDNLDNRSLPGIKLNVVMGRHAGFLTAASALTREREEDGPHLVYLPEVPFQTERFLGDVERVMKQHRRCHIAVSEGIQDEKHQPIASSLIHQGDRDDHGNVQLAGSGALGDGLANLIKERLTPSGGKPPRVRADTFGYAQRCWPDSSPVDRREAREAGRFAAQCALSGDADGSVAIERISTRPYKAVMKLVKLSDVAAKTRHMPPEFIQGTSDVTPAFTDWLRPLVGEMPRVGRL